MEYRDLLPIIIVLGAAVIGVLIEAFAPRGARRIAQLVLSMAALVGALAAVITQAGTQLIVAQGSIAVDGPATRSRRRRRRYPGAGPSRPWSGPASCRPRCIRSPCSPPEACCCSRRRTIC